ncbi:MAG: TrkH family potassium uptake protein [Candidatus Hydrothermarchaeales archaeon]
MIGVLTREDFKIILHNLGHVTAVASFTMLVPAIAAYYYHEIYFLKIFMLSFIVTFVAGTITSKAFFSEHDLKLRHAIGMTALAYLVVPAFSAIPLLSFSPTFIDAFFETVSGWTTTGLSTIASNADSFPHSINLWRHLMQYVGGLGIVVMSLVILSRARTGVESTIFYTAEGREERLGLSIVSTVRAMWGIYLMFLVLATVALYYAGMGWFDSLCHAMAGLSTGGFSTHSNSILYYNSYLIEAVTAVIMIVGSMNFALHYAIITGHFKEITKNIETQTFAVTLGILSLSTVLWLTLTERYASFYPGFRYGFYTIVSGLTTTGWMSESAGNLHIYWAPLALVVVGIAMSIGASTCSTGGGIKCMRFGMIIKSIWWKVRDSLIPEDAVVVRKFHHIRDHVITEKHLYEMFIMVFAYILLLTISTLITSAYGYPFSQSFFEAASALGTVGLTVGITGASMPVVLKILYILDMWAGRLEVISILVFFASLKGLLQE